MAQPVLTNSLGEEQWALLGYPAWLLGTLSVAFTLKTYTGGCGSVAKLCPTLCNPVDCSTPDSPGLYYFSEFVQIHVH